MPSGFRTITNDGVLQIDQQWKTYQLIKKVRITCTGGGANGSARGDYSLKHEGHILVAGRNQTLGQPWFLLGTRKDPNNMWGITVCAPQNNVVELFIFSYGKIAKARNGMNVYASDGSIVFSSAVPYMKIYEFYHIPAAGINITNLPIGDYALVVPAFSSRKAWRPPSYTMFFCNAYTIRDNGFSAAETLWFQRPSSDYSNDGALVSGVGMLIDVSNCKDMVWS